MSKKLVAIVGRPNVGKSTLFNKLIGKRLSIVDEVPSLTRDRIYSECEWRNKKFFLVDTGGIEDSKGDPILSKIKDQALLAIETADVIIFVTDISTGPVASDSEVVSILKKSSKPVVLCVNKCDSIGTPPNEIYEFYKLGLGDPIAASAVHGHGTGDLLDEVFKFLPDDEKIDGHNNAINVAIIGKPNAGKSSLTNFILEEDRSIVSDIAGTTRDSIDTFVETKFGALNLIDTAGIRRKSKVTDRVERYSVLRSEMAIERSDVCVIMLDAQDGFTEQDSKVAGLAHNKGKPCVIAINKWDLIEKDSKTMDLYTKKIQTGFSFMSYAPIVFISAKTGFHIENLLSKIIEVYNMSSIRISTGKLNEVLVEATTRVQPPSDKGKRLKLFYITQPSSNPPTFVIFVNSKKLFHFSYQRYIENQIRKNFDITGTPINIIVRERGEEKI